MLEVERHRTLSSVCRLEVDVDPVMELVESGRYQSAVRVTAVGRFNFDDIGPPVA
jgi:hypothetical protein